MGRKLCQAPGRQVDPGLDTANIASRFISVTGQTCPSHLAIHNGVAAQLAAQQGQQLIQAAIARGGGKVLGHSGGVSRLQEEWRGPEQTASVCRKCWDAADVACWHVLTSHLKLEGHEDAGVRQQ